MSMSNENAGADLPVRGFIKMQMVDAETGKVVGRREVTNRVTNYGLLRIAENMASSFAGAEAEAHVNYAHYGRSSGNAPASDDTDLQSSGTDQARVAANAATVSPGTARFTWSYATNEANEEMAEVGLFGTNTGANCMARATFAATTKDTNMTVSFTYELRFTVP